MERLRGASRQALMALIELAIEHKVAFVLLAGDIYDGNWSDFRTGLFFREQMLRLCGAGIRVFIIKGNHDAESQITKQLPEVVGVHVFSSRKSETIDLEELGVAIHGQSFPSRAVPEDLVPLYPSPIPNRFNIGVLHTSLNGREGHDPYAPTSVGVLCNKGYDYFALGHIHAREVVRESSPRIVFPGNLQGRWAKETGPKGCELVSIENGKITSAEFVALDVVRWAQVTLEAAGLNSISDLVRVFTDRATALISEARDRLHAVRVCIRGETPLHRLEAEEPGTLSAAIQAAIQDFDDGIIWLEEVRLDLRSPVDRATVAKRSDPVGEVVRLVDSINSDDEALKTWFRRHLDSMTHLPPALTDADPAKMNAEAMRSYVADAEATVLAQLSKIASLGL